MFSYLFDKSACVDFAMHGFGVTLALWNTEAMHCDKEQCNAACNLI